MLGDTALTRWRPDATTEAYGYWIYVRDREKRGPLVCGAASRPGRQSPDSTVIFHQHMVEFFQRQTTALRSAWRHLLSPADTADLREITVTNDSDRPREIEFTSYAEIVLAPPLDDERHPAFSKLFVKSDYLGPQRGLLFTASAAPPGNEAAGAAAHAREPTSATLPSPATKPIGRASLAAWETIAAQQRSQAGSQELWDRRLTR